MIGVCCGIRNEYGNFAAQCPHHVGNRFGPHIGTSRQPMMNSGSVYAKLVRNACLRILARTIAAVICVPKLALDIPCQSQERFASAAEVRLERLQGYLP